MDVEVTQENLNRALVVVARVASTRSTLPILKNILFKIVGNRLKISTTNLDIAINRFVGAKINNKGSLTIPARLLQDFVANLPDGTIRLSQEDSKVHIETTNHTSTINGTPPDEFPVTPEIKDGESWSTTTSDLKKALQQVVIAASNDEARPILTGIYIFVSNGKITLASTDSYRLAEKKLDKSTNNIAVILPASAVQDVLRILNDSSGDSKVTITHDNQQIRFQVEESELIARLIDGNYPDYRKLIPDTFETTAVVNKSDLINNVKVSSLFARESAGSVVLSTDTKQKALIIRSVASQVGENQAKSQAEVNKDSEITLNARFLLEGLQAVEGEKVSISFNGKLQPVVIKDTESDDYLHIVMPLKS